MAELEFNPNVVNIIFHDQLRVASRCVKTPLFAIAPRTFFIVDEMHLALNNTQRTSAALETAKLSWNFVGLTGTPPATPSAIRISPVLTLKVRMSPFIVTHSTTTRKS